MNIRDVGRKAKSASISADALKALSSEECRTLEARYSDLLFKYVHTAPRSRERTEFKKQIDELAGILDKPNKKVRTDIDHFQRTRNNIRDTKTAECEPDSSYHPGDPEDPSYPESIDLDPIILQIINRSSQDPEKSIKDDIS